LAGPILIDNGGAALENAKKKLLAFLKMGITPEQLALCIALGVVLGIIPALGVATMFCVLTALVFRLNLAAMQLVNFCIYPIQLALLVPFIRAGEWLFNAKPHKLSLNTIQTMLHADVWGTVLDLWVTILRAVVVWLIVAPIVLVAIYLVLLPLLRKLKLDRIVAGTVASAENEP
jgi:uncharacterized protein (DUF2062 family)